MKKKKWSHFVLIKRARSLCLCLLRVCGFQGLPSSSNAANEPRLNQLPLSVFPKRLSRSQIPFLEPEEIQRQERRKPSKQQRKDAAVGLDAESRRDTRLKVEVVLRAARCVVLYSCGLITIQFSTT